MSAKKLNQDAWMTRWCQSNWGELLQPAPMTISILGTLILLVQGIDDFDLRVECKSDKDVQFAWQYARAPDSFKSCLIQMVTDGTEAFAKAHTQMERIETLADKVPGIVKTMVTMLIQASPRIIARDFPGYLDDLSEIAKQCSESGKACQESFVKLRGLAAELALASQRKLGNTETTINRNAIDIQVLGEQEKRQQELIDVSKDCLKKVARDYEDAQDLFKEASQSVPSGWSIVGMNLVESAMNVGVSAANAYISMSCVSKQVALMGANVLADKVRGDQAPATTSTPRDPKIGLETVSGATEPSTDPAPRTSSAAAATDPGASEVGVTLNCAIAISNLLIVGEDKKVNWDTINAQDNQGARFIQRRLKFQEEKLAPEKHQHFSSQLLLHVAKLLEIVAGIIEASGNSTTDQALLAKLPEIEKVKQSLQSLQQAASQATQSTGNIASPIFTSSAKPSDGKTSAMAVEMAKNHLTQCRSNLEGARGSYQHLTDEVIKQQTELTKLMTEMKQLDLRNQGLKKIVPILIKAVGAFATLQSNITQLVLFFDSIAGLIKDVMAPSVNKLADSLDKSAKDKVAGISLEQFCCNILHQQAMTVSQVSLLAQKIANTYCKVSSTYIMPGQAYVSNLNLQIRDENAKLIQGEVQKAQKVLAEQATIANQGIIDLVRKDQKEFIASIEERLQGLEEVTQGLIAPETPKHLQTGNVRFIESVAAEKRGAADANPMYKSDEELEIRIQSLDDAC